MSKITERKGAGFLGLRRFEPAFTIPIQKRVGTLLRGPVTNPASYWDPLYSLDNSTLGVTSRYFDKSRGVVQVPVIGMQGLASEPGDNVVPFITYGERVLQDIYANTGEPVVRARIKELYAELLSNPHIEHGWERRFLQEVELLQQGIPADVATKSGLIIPRAASLITHTKMGPDGTHPLIIPEGYDDVDKSPVQVEYDAFLASQAVNELEGDARAAVGGNLLTLLNETNARVTSKSGKRIKARAIVAEMIAGTKQTFEVGAHNFSVRILEQRENALSQALRGVSLTEAQAQTNSVDAHRATYDALRSVALAFWNEQIEHVTHPLSGLPGGSMAAIEAARREIAETVVNLGTFDAPTQAAFISAGKEVLLGGNEIVFGANTTLPTVNHTQGALERYPVRDLVTLLQDLNRDGLRAGRDYLNQQVYLADPQRRVAELVAQMRNPIYGALGYPVHPNQPGACVQDEIVRDLNALAEAAAPFDPYAQLHVYQALQQIKPAITQVQDLATQGQLIRMYNEATTEKRLPRLAEGLAQDITVHYENGNAELNTNIEQARADALKLYKGNDQRQKEQIQNQAEMALRQGPIREMWQRLVDCSGNPFYGLAKGTEQNGLYKADQRIVQEALNVLGRTQNLPALKDTYALGKDTYLGGVRIMPHTGMIDDLDALVVKNGALTVGANEYFRTVGTTVAYPQGLVDALFDRTYGIGTEYQRINDVLAEEQRRLLSLAQTFEPAQQMYIVINTQRVVTGDDMPGKLTEGHGKRLVAVLTATEQLTEAFSQIALQIVGQPDQAVERSNGFWSEHMRLLDAPRYRAGGVIDLDGYLQRQRDALAQRIALMDSESSLAFLEAEVQNAFDMMVKTTNLDLQMRLTYQVIHDVINSPIAIALDAREASGQGAKATKTIGEIVTEQVIRAARLNPEIFKRMLPYIETKNKKPPEEQALFVMLLALARFETLTHAAGTPVQAEKWNVLVEATVASIENAYRIMRSGLDSAWMEVESFYMMADPLAVFEIASPLVAGRIAKDARKGKREVRLQAQREIAEHSEWTQAQKAYAYYERTGTIPLNKELQRAWDGDILAILDLADDMSASNPKARGGGFETLFRHTGDIAVVLRDPNQRMSWLSDPDLKNSPEGHEVAAGLLRTMYGLFHDQLRASALNRSLDYPLWQDALAKLRAKPPVTLTEQESTGLLNAKMQARLATQLLMNGALYATREGTFDPVKEETRQLFFDDLTDILLDTQGRTFNPMVRRAALEVLHQWAGNYSNESLTLMYDMLVQKLRENTGAHWKIDDGTTWLGIARATALKANTAIEGGAKPPYREAQARIVLGATLDLLERYAAIGGMARRSPIGTAVHDQVEIYRKGENGYELIPVETGLIKPPKSLLVVDDAGHLSLKDGTLGRSFLHSAVAFIKQFGDVTLDAVEGSCPAEAARVRLIPTLRRLGQDDLLIYATTHKDMRPPMDPTGLIAQSEAVTSQIAQAALTVADQLSQVINMVRGRMATGIEIDPTTGLIKSIEGAPALTAQLVAEANQRYEKLRKDTNIEAHEETASGFTSETVSAAPNSSGLSLAASLVEKLGSGQVDFGQILGVIGQELQLLLQQPK